MQHVFIRVHLSGFIFPNIKTLNNDNDRKSDKFETGLEIISRKRLEVLFEGIIGGIYQ